MSHKELRILTFPLFFQFSWIHSNQILASTTLLKLIMAVSSMATSLPSSVHNSQIIILITWLSASFDPLDHHPKTPTYFGYLDIKDRGAQLFLHLLLFDLFWLNIEVPRPLSRWYPSLPYLYSYLHNIYIHHVISPISMPSRFASPVLHYPCATSPLLSSALCISTCLSNRYLKVNMLTAFRMCYPKNGTLVY